MIPESTALAPTQWLRSKLGTGTVEVGLDFLRLPELVSFRLVTLVTCDRLDWVRQASWVVGWFLDVTGVIA